ncbi:hypothetical protein ACA910_013611 [Epithemia clementina (nom. ined.)]
MKKSIWCFLLVWISFIVKLAILSPFASAFSLSSTLSRSKASVVDTTNKPEIINNTAENLNDDVGILDVAIVGAGPAGLVLAHALLQRGYSVRVIERRDAFRPVGAAVFMHPFALNSLRSVSPEVERNLKEACTPIQIISLTSLQNKNVNVFTDKLDDATDVFGAPFIAIRFWDMLCALRTGLPDEVFRFGHDIQGFEQLKDGGVNVNYKQTAKDGEGSFRAKLLIDASGIRSKIRQQLVGDKPIPRLRATYAVASANNVKSVLGGTDHLSIKKNGFRKLAFVLGDGVSVTTASLANGDVWWTQTRFTDDPTKAIPVGNDLTLQEQLNERFAVWPSHVRGLVQATEFHEIIESTIAELPVSWKWGQGYDVTLLGDAAHAQLPALGLGVSTAFADVDELCRQIDKFGLTRKALRWYEFVRIPQTAFLQLASRMAYFINLHLGTSRKKQPQ